MSTNGISAAEESEMAECDGEKVVTMMDVLQEQQEFEEDANAVLGASDDKNCTYAKGYIKRQAVYACMTCCADAKADPSKRAGVCLACSLSCHENHELIELYTKRNFRCDCGNPKFNSNPCQFNPNKTELNDDNRYNQNYSGVYCICQRPYPDPESTVEDEMIQCIICEDWLHASHLDAVVPAIDQYAEMICKGCMENNEFIHDYSDLALTVENVDIEVGDKSMSNGETTKSVFNVNGDNENNGNAESNGIGHTNIAMDVDLKDNTDLTTNPKTNSEQSKSSEENFNVITPGSSIASANIEDKSKTQECEYLEENLENQNVIINETEKFEAVPATSTAENKNYSDSEVKNDNNLEKKYFTISEESEINVNIKDNNKTDAQNTNEINKEDESTENTNKLPTMESNNILEGNGETANSSVGTVTTTNIENLAETIEKQESNVSVTTDNTKTNETTESKIVYNDSVDTDLPATAPEQSDKVEISNTPVIMNGMELQTKPKNIMEIDKMNEETNIDSVHDKESKTDNLNREPVESELPTNMNENKRKLSTEDNEDRETVKKMKCEEVKSCVRPKGVKKHLKGATFWPSNFRQKLCTCNECLAMYKDLAVLFLIDTDDTVTAYEALGKERTEGNSSSQYEKGLEALSSLDRIQQINALTEYNKMRDKLVDFLKSFKDRKEIVKEEDIKAFFAGMKPKREPDGVYFCR